MTTLALKIEGLTKTYPNGFQALKGIDLEVKAGAFIALLGPNGAGKSTTIHIMTSLVQKTAGHVSIFGHDIDQDFESAKRAVGIVPQEFNFNQFEKVQDIILTQAGYYGIKRKEALPVVEKLLKQLGLWKQRAEPSRNLSGGMKRRLMIARALVHQPKFLILDEPTAGVDIELRRSMWDFLTELNQSGTTIMLTTHYLEEAEQLCERIAIIDQGQIVLDQPKQELFAQFNSETFVLELMEPTESRPEFGFTHQWLDDQNLQVTLVQPSSLNHLMSDLSQVNVLVKSIKPKNNRLEELFLSWVEKGQQG